MSSEEKLKRQAKRRAEQKIGFYTHFSVYVMVNLFLILVWFATSDIHDFPWFVFPLVGWGIGIVAHFMSAFGATTFVDKLTEKEIEKLKEKEE